MRTQGSRLHSWGNFHATEGAPPVMGNWGSHRETNPSSYPLIRAETKLPLDLPMKSQALLWPKACPVPSRPHVGRGAHVHGAGQQGPRAEGLPDDLEQTGRWLLQVEKLRDAACEVLKPLHGGPAGQGLVGAMKPVENWESRRAPSTALSSPREQPRGCGQGRCWDTAGLKATEEVCRSRCGPGRCGAVISRGQLSTLPGTRLRPPPSPPGHPLPSVTFPKLTLASCVSEGWGA